MKIAALALLCSIPCSFPGIAIADDKIVTFDRTCVEIDTDADGLVAPDRAHARELMQRVLERADQLVVTTGCTETYVLSHERAEGGYVIRLRSEAGKRRMKTDALVDLADKYARLARSLLEAKALAAVEPPAPDPAAPPVAQPAVAALPAQPSEYSVPTADNAEALEADEPQHPKTKLWYTMLGLQLTGGISATGGYRKQLSSVTIDIAGTVRGSDDGGSGSSLGLKLLHTTQSSDHALLYAGGGLGIGSTHKGSEHDYYPNHGYFWGSGVEADFTAGLQLGRASGTQFLAQLDVTLPFYEIGNDIGDKDYVAAAVLSGGVGW
jgi:hypothetical protein